VIIESGGQAHLDGGSIVSVNGFSLRSGGMLRVAEGVESRIETTQPSFRNAFSGSTILDGDLRLVGNTNVLNGATFAGPGTLIHEGVLETQADDFTIGTHVRTEGVLSPKGGIVGISPGLLRLTAGYTQAAIGFLRIDVDGLAAGTQHDQVLVTGMANLDGRVSLGRSPTMSSYDPVLGDQLTFLTATGGVSGRFAEVGVIIDFNSPDEMRWAVTYDANNVYATVALPGDANLDGFVNLQDFNTLASNFGQSGLTWVMADFTGDGLVTLADFNLLAGNFGLSAGPEGPTAQDWAALASAVPEPATVTWVAGAALLMRRRRT
jgi:hypothetical protein